MNDIPNYSWKIINRDLISSKNQYWYYLLHIKMFQYIKIFPLPKCYLPKPQLNNLKS